jgi:hypothetical protein
MSIPIYVGFDQREACVFHVFTQSVIEHATQPVAFYPLATNHLHFDGQQDGTNAFIFSRYLVPELQGFEGWAIFADGDMHLNADISELWELRDDTKAVMVVKHDYHTKSKRKYIGTPIENDNVDYECKNWSSVILFNCGHPANRILTRRYVAEAGGALLHRFAWLNDEEIGTLPLDWNWLEQEYPYNPDAKLVHQTLGSPGFASYADSDSSRDWNGYLLNSLEMIGERPSEMVRRAHWNSYGSNNIIRNAPDRHSGLFSAGRPDLVHSELCSER